ncbi:actin family protein [Thecamonas trahens ATCC 50062]|uniref:Actin family protein n=1 Tax=Thecamonas trahens ATCC 50062 TaxID=461836 RepID=A0A0L0DTB6_THETB|nr:actin family protein [Thecamonas trahens ATCC 50062]KNC54693.1 actin family protein [Thecamonas trahens ATCC 50062]|eukprot:XP_013761595.1 actin family protein [Thecamonas trahens ATCC 50062]
MAAPSAVAAAQAALDSLGSTATTTLVVDNGGGSIKAGLVGADGTPVMVPNVAAKPHAVRRSYVGAEVAEATNRNRLYLRRPVDRGYVTNWNLETRIWSHVLRDTGADPSASTLLMLMPMFAPPSIAVDAVETLFEDLGFAALALSTPPAMVGRDYMARTGEPGCLVLDAGFSFTHALPFFGGTPVTSAVRRLDLGGKALSNHLAALLSYRTVDLRRDPMLVTHIKETCCTVASDYLSVVKGLSGDGPASPGELRNSLTARYLLPNYTTVREGRMLADSEDDPENMQVLRFALERLSVPELLFHPSDAGLDECGVHELIADAVAATPQLMRIPLYNNIIAVGGSTLFPGFLPRLEADLRPLVEASYDLTLHRPPPQESAIDHAWHAASRFAASPAFSDHIVTQAQFAEEGFSRIESFFLDLAL